MNADRGMESTSNKDAFIDRLKKEYYDLFLNNVNYSYSAKTTSPKDLAEKMTNALINGTANKEGLAIKRVCKHFNLPHTYKAIKEFLSE